MKYLIILSVLFTSLAFGRELPKRRYYINTPQGPVQVMTPQDYKRMEEKKKKNDDLNNGQGQEYISRAEVKDGKVVAWVRGCNRVEIGDANQKAEEGQEVDEAEIKRLKSVRNGDVLKIKMVRFGSCEVGGWSKN